MLRSRYNNKDIIENLLNDLVAKDCRELLGCDNMSGILIEFNWWLLMWYFISLYFFYLYAIEIN